MDKVWSIVIGMAYCGMVCCILHRHCTWGSAGESHVSFVKSSKVQMVSQSVYVRIVDKESLWYVVVYTGGIPQWLDTDNNNNNNNNNNLLT